MANQTITQLPDAGPITGTELVPVVQNGGTYKTTAAALAGSPVQTQTFLTLNQEPTLNNSRYLSTGDGLTLVDNGAQNPLRIDMTGAAASLNVAGDGLMVKVNSVTLAAREMIAGTNGLSIADGNGIAGNPTVSLTGQVLSLANASGPGLVALPNNGTVTPRSIIGTANQIDVLNGNAAAGDPTISISDDPVLGGTGGVTLPSGDTSERPALPADGLIRFNTETDRFEGNTAGGWEQFGYGDGTVTSVNAIGGDTGLSFSGGPITSSGTLVLEGIPTKATNLAGGAANRIAYQTSPNTTGFIDAPTNPDTLLKYNGTGFEWGTVPGTGTVTSVGLSMPSDFVVSNSPVTSSGSLTAAWASQPANYVLASPNGTTGTPAFRAFENADLPNSGVTANTYGSSGAIPVITVNAKGVITGVALATTTGGLVFQGSWDAATNTPPLASSVGTNGFYYVVSVAGSTDLNGITDWQIGDWAIFNGTIWQKIDQTNLVSSVNGQVGAVDIGYANLSGPIPTWNQNTTGTAAGLSSTLVVASGGTGATTFTSGSYLKGNGTGAITAQTGIPAGDIASGLLPVARGGTGTATPALVQGTNITITGSWPNQTINSTAGGMVYPGAGIPVSTGSAWGTSLTPAPSSALVGVSDTQTLTNKRITPRVSTAVTAATPFTWNSNDFDQINLTAVNADLYIAADSGTPTDGQQIVFRLSGATASTLIISWPYGVSNGVRQAFSSLPVTLTSKTVYIQFRYNALAAIWDAVLTSQEP